MGDKFGLLIWLLCHVLEYRFLCIYNIRYKYLLKIIKEQDGSWPSPVVPDMLLLTKLTFAALTILTITGTVS